MAAAEPISPELVLVSPELRERALATLPAVDADALFLVVARPTPRTAVARPMVHSAPAAEPRGSFPLAFAAYVAEAVVLGALRATALIAAIAVAAFLLAR